MTEASVPTDGDAAGGRPARPSADRLDRATAPIARDPPLARGHDRRPVRRALRLRRLGGGAATSSALNLQAAALGVPLTGWGVALLVAALVVPFLVFGVAFWLGRRRGPLVQVVLFLAGYALVQALTLDLSALFGLGGFDFS